MQLPSNWANEMLLMVPVTYGRKSLLVTLVHLFCSAIMVSCDRFANPLRALSFVRALIQYPFVLSQVRQSVVTGAIFHPFIPVLAFRAVSAISL